MHVSAGGSIIGVDSAQGTGEGVIARRSRGYVKFQVATHGGVQLIPLPLLGPAELTGRALAAIELAVVVGDGEVGNVQEVKETAEEGRGRRGGGAVGRGLRGGSNGLEKARGGSNGQPNRRKVDHLDCG